MPEQQQTKDQQVYEYFAFISYSHKDEKWAEWLQRKLEQYRLPAALCKELEPLPKSLKPIFMDRTDLTGGQLHKALKKELNLSKKLILISSPNAARSEWVNKEVQHFIDSGRYEDIIPLIVDGVPNDEEHECFPEALKRPEEEQLLGISVSELGGKDAFLRVAAALLEIKFDQLKRRHDQRKKRQNIIAAAALVLLLAIAGPAGYMAWDYFIPGEAYFTDYVLRWGIPEGIGPLAKRDVAVRESHYIIVTHKGRTVRLIHANSAGTPVPHEHTERRDRPMIAEYSYMDGGRLGTVEYKDRKGRVLLIRNYAPDLKAADFQTSREGGDVSFQTLAASATNMEYGMFGMNDTFNNLGKSDITRHVYEYDEDGYIVKTIFMRDSRNTPVIDAEGIGGLMYTLDSYGRPVEVSYLSLGGGELTATKQNAAGKRYAYDDAGNLIRAEYINPLGEPALNERGWMIFENEFDANGNCVKEAYYDADGGLLLNKYGVAYVTAEYDNRGNRVKTAFWDTDGRPALHAEGAASFISEYDERGNATKHSYFDTEGKPIINSYGFASVEYKFDEWGNVIKISCLGTDNQPFLGVYGFAFLEIQYDEHGNLAKQSYFDPDGRPVLGAYGFAAREIEYDQRGNITKIYNLGTDGRLALNAYGYAVVKYEYDERYNEIRKSYFGPDGEPALVNGEYAAEEKEYDERGAVISHLYFDLNNRPVSYPKDGPAIEEPYNGLPVLFIIAREINQDSPAMAVGIQPSDIIVQFGSWNYFDKNPTDPFDGLDSAISTELEKEVIIYRPSSSECIAYFFTESPIGVHLMDLQMSDLNEALHLYREAWEAYERTVQLK